MLNDNGKIVGVIGSSLMEDVEVGKGGDGDGDAGVIGSGDNFLIGSENIRRVGDGVWGFVCWSILAKKIFNRKFLFE